MTTWLSVAKVISTSKYDQGYGWQVEVHTRQMTQIDEAYNMGRLYELYCIQVTPHAPLQTCQISHVQCLMV